MNRSLARRITVITGSAVILIVAAWMSVHPSGDDPRSLKYVLWKHHLYKLDPDTAIHAMVLDTESNRLVVGKTKAELLDRFGSLVPAADAAPALRDCYKSSPWKDKTAVFIRTSPWMVVFEGDRGSELVLMKDCWLGPDGARGK
jgi:hypothetical protein